MNKRAAAVYFRDGKAYTTPESLTKDRIWISTPPCFVDLAEDVQAIAQSVVRALGRSQADIPTPGQSENLFSHVLEAANVKSNRTFSGGSDGGVWIEEVGGAVALTPMGYGDPRKGFVLDESAAESVSLEPMQIAEVLGKFALGFE